MKRLFISVILFLLPVIALAQYDAALQRAADSIRQLIKTAKHDTLKIKAMFALDDVIYIVDPEGELKVMEESYDLCMKNRNKTKNKTEQQFYTLYAAKSLNIIGSYYRVHGDNKTAEQKYQAGLKLARSIKHKRCIAVLQSNLGIVYKTEGDFAKAISFYTNSLKTLESIHDTMAVLNLLNNIGVIYIEQDEEKRALVYLEKSLALSRKKRIKPVEAGALSNIGTIYQHLNDYERATKYFTESLALKKEVGDQYGVSNCLVNLGDASFSQKKYDKAASYYEEGLVIKEKIGDMIGLSNALTRVGTIYILRKNYAKAIQYCERSYKIAKEAQAIQEIRLAAEALYSAYSAVGQYKPALEMYRLSVQLRDSVNSENAKRELVRQEFKYTYEKKAMQDSIRSIDAKKIQDAKLAAANSKLNEERANLANERSQKIILYGGLALTLIFGLFMFNRFRVTSRQKNIISEQKRLVEEQKLLVEEKQKEVMDSIHYAKRIQKALLPSDRNVERNLKRLKEKS